MRRRLRALNRVLTAAETAAAGALVAAIAVVVLLQVLMRYLFAQPNPWSEEVSRFCFLWASLLGASLAVEHRSHFRFDQALGKLPPRLKRAVETGAGAVVLLFSLLLIVTGAALVVLTAGERSPALDLPMAFVHAAAPVSGAAMAIHLLAGRFGDSRTVAGSRFEKTRPGPAARVPRAETRRRAPPGRGAGRGFPRPREKRRGESPRDSLPAGV